MPGSSHEDRLSRNPLQEPGGSGGIACRVPIHHRKAHLTVLSPGASGTTRQKDLDVPPDAF